MQIRDYYPLTNSSFIQHLHIFSYVFMAVSILYLIAANWLMLPDSIQLAIPPVILLVTAWFSTKDTLSDGVRQTLHSVCGLMIGLSLAVIGQVYQTGADSYLLFNLDIAFTAVVISTEYWNLCFNLYYQSTYTFLFLNRLSGLKSFLIYI